MCYLAPDIRLGAGVYHREYPAIFDVYTVYIVVCISSQRYIASLRESRDMYEISESKE